MEDTTHPSGVIVVSAIHGMGQGNGQIEPYGHYHQYNNTSQNRSTGRNYSYSGYSYNNDYPSPIWVPRGGRGGPAPKPTTMPNGSGPSPVKKTVWTSRRTANGTSSVARAEVAKPPQKPVPKKLLVEDSKDEWPALSVPGKDSNAEMSSGAFAVKPKGVWATKRGVAAVANPPKPAAPAKEVEQSPLNLSPSSFPAL